MLALLYALRAAQGNAKKAIVRRRRQHLIQATDARCVLARRLSVAPPQELRSAPMEGPSFMPI